MKLTGITGTGSGKMGNAVFSVAAGEQIVRQYQPNVANPSTLTQVNNRARLKLLSQLSAVMGDVIAIPREGLKSPRNLFTSDNYRHTSAVDGVASANLAAFGITRGGLSLPNVIAERNETTSIDVQLAESASRIVSRVIYVMFVRNSLGELQLVDSAVVETAGAAGTFPYSFAYQNQDVIIYSYGIFDKSAKATAKFGNYYVTSGTQVADLIAERKIDESDYLITKTKGIVVAGDINIEITSCVCNTIAVPASGSASVPYDSSVAVEVTAVDVAGKYLSVLIDGVRGNRAIFDSNGYSYVGAGPLAGGEQIQIQIGSLVGGTFIPEFTYGGTAVIAAQASAFTSVTANDVAVAAAGNTQISEAASIAFAIAATGVTNKYLRLSVNGTARTPIAFENGAASDTISGLSDGDVVTFAIGHMSGSTFVQDVAFGGSAVIAEVPASFVSVSCNGTTIAASGTTDVQPAAENVYQISTANAIGKYLGVLDSTNTVVEVIPISQNSFQYTDNAEAGDQTKFAIGTGSTTQSFVAQTNFGGTVNFVNTTQYTISASVTPANRATVTGTGLYASGATCTLVCTPNEGYDFVGWYLGSTLVSANPSYSFTVLGSQVYTAIVTLHWDTKFSGVSLNSADWNANKVLGTNVLSVSGQTSLADARKVCLVASNDEKPTRNSGINIYSGHVGDTSVSNGSFTISDAQAQYGNRYWLVAYQTTEDGDVITDVFDYNVFCSNE